MKGKFLFFDKYLILVLDILILIGIEFIFNNKIDTIFILYIIIFWIISALYTKFYNVYRYTSWNNLINQCLSHYFIFFLAYFSFFGLINKSEVINNQSSNAILLIIAVVTILKIVIFSIQKHYRAEGNNPKKTILFGSQSAAFTLSNLFEKRPDLGYKFEGFFSEKEDASNIYLGSLKKGFEFVLDNNIEEIFCDSQNLPSARMQKIREFARQNEIELRYIPEHKAIYSKDLVLENYGTVSILKPKKLPFEKIETHIIKRIFDILFSLSVFIIIFSWLLPILWVVVKLNSKGPFFFKQKRDGRNGTQFNCYKIRSMTLNADADKVSAKKDDKRITKVGAFLRKTSLDELPQFINVFLGDMSIVGPRPHMNLHTKKYEKEIDNYLLRHEVKPGITGLAQISGYRGEVIEKSDIQNRVRLDIFYIENWSFVLDLKIIVKTLINVFVKEDKAY